MIRKKFANISNRILRVQGKLEEKSADALFVVNRENSGQPGMKYLSGFDGSESVLLIAQNKKYLFTDGRYFQTARNLKTDYAVKELGKNFKLRMTELCKRERVIKILFDGERMSFSNMERIKKILPAVSFVNESNLLQKIREVKDKKELRLMKKSADITCEAFLKLLPLIKEGKTEKAVAEKLEKLLKKAGAEKPAFEIIVASGKNSALPHARPTNKKLRRGELVVIDFGAVYKGYLSDMTRTVAIGKISPKLRRIYETVENAQREALATVRAGVPARTLDSIARKVIEKAGYDKYFVHSTGHGVGMEIHELPTISKGSEEKLQENSVITIEPGIYIPGLGGVRIEDMVIVRKSGSENLTEKATKKLIVR